MRGGQWGQQQRRGHLWRRRQLQQTGQQETLQQLPQISARGHQSPLGGVRSVCGSCSRRGRRGWGLWCGLGLQQQRLLVLRQGCLLRGLRLQVGLVVRLPLFRWFLASTLPR